MAWNGSNQRDVKGQRSEVKQGNGKHRSSTSTSNFNYKALCAGLIVVALGGAAVWWFGRGRSPSGPQDGRDGARPSQIAEVKPQISTNKIVSTPPKTKGKHLKPYHYWEQENTNGFTEAMQLKWRQVRRPRLPPVDMPKTKRPFEIFDHTSENVIACLLTLEPGKGLFGYPTYRGIEKDFLKSCETPIVIKSDDDDYTKQLKQAMIETKIEIRDRMRNGETLEDIIKETCDEARKLAELKDMTESELMRMRREKASPEELNDFIEAANKFLGNKGISPIHVSPIIKQKIKHLMKESNQGE